MCHHFHALNSTNVAVLSLGTGNFRFNVDLEGDMNADWGLRQWAPHLLNVLMDGASQKTDLALNMVLQDKYVCVRSYIIHSHSVSHTQSLNQLTLINNIT